MAIILIAITTPIIMVIIPITHPTAAAGGSL